MRKGVLFTFISVFIFLAGNQVKGGPGDTVHVYSKDTIHWDSHGAYFTEAIFPPEGQSYQKVWLKATLGCPSHGCSEWDYTVKFAIMDSTGKIDSTEVPAPSFRVEDEIKDTFKFMRDTSYQYVYDNSNNEVDTVPRNSIKVVKYEDPNNPLQPTDSLHVWPAEFYQYEYDGNGNKIDSSFLQADTSWIYNGDSTFKKYEVVTPIEIGRAATPYSGNKGPGWSHPWYFDVTDYQMLMEGKKNLRAYYRGPRDGFTISFEFIMIEGTPGRMPVSVQNIYKSPATGFFYGYDTSDINGDRLVPRELKIPANAEEAKIRVSIKGHGFGDANGNCAEFCNKWYKLLFNGEEFAQHNIWDDHCDMVPIYPQTGTWIYSRTNWCPGDISLPYDHEITDKISPGETFNFKMNMQNHNFIAPDDGNFTHPRWVVDVQLLTFNEKNFKNDVAIHQIIAPSDNPNHGRFNPTCGSPIIVIQNNGSKELTSAMVTYGGKNSDKQTYKWEGNLDFGELDTVTLPAGGDWGYPYKDLAKFEVTVDKPNGVTDEYEENNYTHTSYSTVPKYPNKFRLLIRTNSAADETSYILRRKWGTVFYQRSDFENNTQYIDTFNLPRGCYEFIIKDKRATLGVGDGLSFFANNEGSGFARLIHMDNVFPLDNGNFEPNFGRQIRKSFTVGFTLGKEDNKERKAYFKAYPNPAEEVVNIDLRLNERKNIKVKVHSSLGKTVKRKRINSYRSEGFKLDVENWQPGVYFLEINTGDDIITKRFIKN